MGLRSGLAAQLGIKSESVYGTPVTVDTFTPLVKDGLSNEISQLKSAGLIAGKRTPSTDQQALGATKIGGDVSIELYNKGMRFYFLNMFGGESGGGPYTYTPGDLTGVSFTAQIGKPGVGSNTVPAFTYAGCKVASWKLGIKENEIATLDLSIIAQKEIGYRTVTDGVTATDTSLTSATAAFGPDDVGKPVSGTGIPAATTIASVTSTTVAVLSAATTASASGLTITIGLALASASYSSAQLPFHYDQATLTIGGSAVKVKEATLGGDNGLADSRRFLGQRWIEEPLEVALRKYSGTLMAEFTDRTQYQRYVNGLDAALVVTLTAGTATITITQNVRFVGTTPQVDGPDIVNQALPYEALATSGGADSTAITAVLSAA